MAEPKDPAALQADFLAAITAATPAAVDFSPAALAVYRNNYRVGLEGALALAYPVVAAIVGADFFHGLAQAYIAHTPSHSGNLHLYGESFGAFLDGFGPAASLPYLPDTARLEWCLHRLYYHADVPVLDAAALGERANRQGEALTLPLSANARCFASSHPVGTIWLAHRAGTEEQVDLDAPGERLLLYRAAGEVDLRRLDAAGAAWLSALAEGATLESATDAALVHDPGFDLQGWLAFMLTGGLFAA